MSWRFPRAAFQFLAAFAILAPAAQAQQPRGEWVALPEPAAPNPQISIGSDSASWMNALDARAIKLASAPVGAPIPGLGI